MNIQKFLKKKIKKICIKLGLPENFNPIIQKNIKKKNIDYQINGIIKLKKKKSNYHYKLAKKISYYMNKSKIYKKISISKPGFINITLDSNWICTNINNMFIAKNFNISFKKPKKIIIDYSSPNIAKEMHVGHLRSTILGDTTARILKFLGHNVIKQNHIGDWGIQFGMLITQLKLESKISFKNIEKIYKKSYLNYKKNPIFFKKTKKNVVKLQKKDKKCIYIWKKIVKKSIKKNNKVYKKLNVSLKKKDIRGESFYNFMLPGIISDLKKKKIAVNYQGCVIVYLKNFKNRLGKKMGVVIQKKDGAFLYTTTDIACLKYRCKTLKADRIIYYIDNRQKQHLLQIWNIAKKAKYFTKKILLEHHSFGMILHKNKKPFKTRNGDTIKLIKLLNKGVTKAKEKIKKKNRKIKKKELKKIAHNIGIGAIKYFDLSKKRKLDYIFDWDKMLSLEGNTAPYIQYAYIRIKSIIKKNTTIFQNDKYKINIFTSFERQLIFSIFQFEEIIHILEKKGTPHLMCNYLYDLSGKFSKFYENCSILNAKEKHIKISRIKLSILTSKIIKKCLYFLGIKTVSKM
ncbi:arginine--tRNA ligase [Buchnera aphidicola]|uniref:Arginine--tRNA ligase n=1 Tax=Buchnera aphidicola subsp. Cinara cedri (strain Cc) TaxID=372461 RepID=SYR_BUCCC|nr:arginine--tRNA ligase [Buchnera aphidicola]Q057S1.1 RecName: Full=Arginine--tRNA ligase; AltName: Full=Arginyl-tRNA synthetase; Short=ArgRS [Buchnera aphidicola BCc]ABJ90628.1 arginyl-tRNA synthetase [Buchnera aphidicola BCc]